MSANTDEAAMRLGELEKRLLNDFQREFPLSPTPYADIAAHLGITEQAVLETLERLQAQGVVSRVGPVFRPHRLGASLLAAMAVPAERLLEVAELVSGYPEVNHNYEREHHFNLWFVLTADSTDRIEEVLEEIERRSGLPVMALPMVESYHADLGFDLKW